MVALVTRLSVPLLVMVAEAVVEQLLASVMVSVYVAPARFEAVAVVAPLLQ